MPNNLRFYGTYVVGFFDLLNQKEQLKQLSTIPDDPLEQEKHKQKFREVWKPIKDFRDSFIDYFTSYSTLVDTKPHTQTFLDSVITSCRVADDNEQYNASGLY